MGEVGHSPHVRINRPCFYHVDEANQTIGLEESWSTVVYFTKIKIKKQNDLQDPSNGT